MKKLSIDIDLTQLEGASIINRDGRDFLIVNIAKCRAKFMTRKNGQKALFLKLDAVERKQAGENGDTHFICEPVTKQEREQGVRLPIIGSGKEWGDMGMQKKKDTGHVSHDGQTVDGMEEDEIPF